MKLNNNLSNNASKEYKVYEDLGTVVSVLDDVVYIVGLFNGSMSEQIEFVGKELKGVINYLDNLGMVGVTVLGNSINIMVGDSVKRLDKQPLLKSGDGILGRVVNCIGEPLDGQGPIVKGEEMFIEREAPSIIDREPVNEPLETGVKFVDSMIPIGCGQRELIIGDSKTGKTSVAVDSIINQKGREVICVYVAIGQRAAGVRHLQNVLKKRGGLDYTSIVVATASDSSVMQYMSPFAGCAVAEYFMLKGSKVLVVYDDLSKHAVAYRQMALLLRRPPGREGYPGDVFYLHSRLLERSARLMNVKDEKTGLTVIGGSITAFPVIETIDGDVSAYIPTNVISITDGQVYLEKEVFNKGIMPAISPGISVSRVGSAAQSKIMKELSGSLKLELAQYRELEEFARLGLSLDEMALYTLVKGEKLQ